MGRTQILALEATLAAIQIGFAVLFLAYGGLRLGSAWPVPQWVTFFNIYALTRFGQMTAWREARLAALARLG